MKARIATIIVIITGLLGLMIWTGEVAIAALIAAILFVFGAAVIANVIAARKIDVSFHPTEGDADTRQICIRILLKNHSIFPVFKGRIRVLAENTNFGFWNKEDLFFSLSGKGEQCLEISVESDFCGRYRIFLKNVQIIDVWGITRITVVKNLKTEACLFPKWNYIGNVSEKMVANYEKERKFSGQKGHILSDILQYREYRKGDSLKHVNWKLSAKQEELILREFDTPVDNQILIIPDIREGNADIQNMAYGVLFSICMTYLKQQIPYRMAFSENRSVNFIEINHTDSLFRSMREILTAQSDSDVGAFDAVQARENLHKYAQILYITNDLKPELGKRMLWYKNVNMVLVNEKSFRKERFEEDLRRLVV